MVQDMGAVRPALAGRARELDDLRRAVAAAWRGSGLLTLLVGEAGIGKTRLAEEIADELASGGALVAWATCTRGEPPWWPWRAALRQCGRHVHRPGIENLLAAGDPDQGLFRILEDAAGAIATVAASRQVLLVLDDLHLADVASLHLLRFLVDELRGDPVAVVACMRRPGGGPQSGPLEDVARRAAVVPLGGLPDEALSAVVAESATEPLDETALERLLARARGNPLFAGELARLRGDPAAPLPPTVRAAVADRLHGLPAEIHELLGSASVVGAAFTLDVLAEVTGPFSMPLPDLCAVAVREGMLRPVAGAQDRFMFAHPLFPEVLRDAWPPSRVRDLHRRIADALEARPGSTAAEIADHAFGAAEFADPATTLRRLDVAASEASRLCAWEDSAVAWARSLQVVRRSGVGDRAELLLRLGEARMRAGDWPEAIAAYQDAAAEARRAGDARLLARAALGLGSGLGGFEVRLHDQAQLDLLREARDALGSDDPDLLAWVLARLSVALSLEGDLEERAALTNEAVALARSLGARRPLAYALASRCDVLAGPAHRERRLADAGEVVALAQEEGDRELELLGRRLLVVALLESGDLAGVDAERERFARTADRLRQPLFGWYVHLWEAMRRILQDDLEGAVAAADRAAAVGRRAHSGNAEILVQVQRISLLAAAGRHVEAADLCERAFPSPDFPATPGWLAGLYAAAGRDDDAVSLLDRLTAERFTSVPCDSEWVAALCVAASGAIRVRHRAAATVLRELLTPYAGHWAVDGIGAACLGVTARYLAGLAEVLGLTAEARELAERAEHAHRAAGIRRPALATASGPPRTAVFRRDGDVWTVVYDGTTSRLRHAKGLHDLARLLANPGRELHVLDLVTASPNRTGPGTDRSGAEGLHAPGDAGSVLDETARRQYQQRLAELDELIELEDIEPERAATARAEREALVDALATAYGLGGRARRLDDPVERARSAVTQRIRAAIRRVGEQHPALGMHLQNSVRTGNYCSYQPERPVSWEL